MYAKAAAPALIVAAMALVGDYSAAAQSHSTAQHQVAPFKQGEMQEVIAEMVRGWTELDSDYLSIVAAVVERDDIDEAFFLKNMELLKAVRQLESAMEQAAVPASVAADHLRLRRAIAKVRGRLAIIDHQFRQHFIQPEVFESQLSGKALADLADHTTQQLARLA